LFLVVADWLAAVSDGDGDLPGRSHDRDQDHPKCCTLARAGCYSKLL
jgi:hypothetical protein